MRLIAERVVAADYSDFNTELDRKALFRRANTSFSMSLKGLRGRRSSEAALDSYESPEEASSPSRNKYYVQGELRHKLLELQPANAPKSHTHHIYCSPHNIGARELIGEIGVQLNLKVETTDQLDTLKSCEHFLLYLTDDTWTSGSESDALADEIRAAMDMGKPLLLAHEMVGFGSQDARNGCEFSTFFSNPKGATPTDLLQRNIYGQIAVPLKGGRLRVVSLYMLAHAICNFEYEDVKLRSRRMRRGGNRGSITRVGVRRVSNPARQGSKNSVKARVRELLGSKKGNGRKEDADVPPEEPDVPPPSEGDLQAYPSVASDSVFVDVESATAGGDSDAEPEPAI